MCCRKRRNFATGCLMIENPANRVANWVWGAWARGVVIRRLFFRAPERQACSFEVKGRPYFAVQVRGAEFYRQRLQSAQDLGRIAASVPSAGEAFPCGGAFDRHRGERDGDLLPVRISGLQQLCKPVPQKLWHDAAEIPPGHPEWDMPPCREIRGGLTICGED